MVSLNVNCAVGLWNTVMVSDTKVLSHPVLGSPTISSITYSLSTVFELLVSANDCKEIGVDGLFTASINFSTMY